MQCKECVQAMNMLWSVAQRYCMEVALARILEWVRSDLLEFE